MNDWNREILFNNTDTSKSNKLNILLAEDEVANQLLMQRMLNIAGHTVTIANNGLEALDYLSSNSYDICIFDMQMPVMNGIEAVVSYKNENKKSELPFIMLTANTKKEAIEQCKNSGADMYLAKPIGSKALLQAINDIISGDADKPLIGKNKSSIDITNLNNFDDQIFLDEFIEIFKESADKLAEDLGNALENNYDNFMKIIHSIKGLSGNIGAQALREMTIKAEELSDDGYKKNSSEYYNKIVTELSTVRDDLVKLASNNR